MIFILLQLIKVEFHLKLIDFRPVDICRSFEYSLLYCL